MSESEPKPSGPGPTAGFIFFESQRKRTKRNSVTCGGHFCCGRSVLWRPPIEKYRLSSPWVPLAKRGDGVSGLPGFFCRPPLPGNPTENLFGLKNIPCDAAGGQGAGRVFLLTLLSRNKRVGRRRGLRLPMLSYLFGFFDSIYIIPRQEHFMEFWPCVSPKNRSAALPNVYLTE